jgi:DnaJ-domain-containing protein 1
LEEDARRQEEDVLRRRKEDEEIRERHRVAGALGGPEGSLGENEVFDPCIVLVVPRDASIEAVDAAYQKARLKYSPDHVAHPGAELQEHYRRKAEAVDRAYLMLIG